MSSQQELLFYDWCKKQHLYKTYIHHNDIVVNIGYEDPKVINFYQTSHLLTPHVDNSNSNNSNNNNNHYPIIILDDRMDKITQHEKECKESKLYNVRLLLFEPCLKQELTMDEKSVDKEKKFYFRLINDKIIYKPGSINIFNLQLSYFSLLMAEWIYTFLKPDGYFIGAIFDSDLLPAGQDGFTSWSKLSEDCKQAGLRLILTKTGQELLSSYPENRKGLNQHLNYYRIFCFGK